MRVVKFGGSSVADAERMLRCARIVAAHNAAEPTVVVVSAMSGVTDGLLRAAEAACAGRTGERQAELARIERQHAEAYRALVGHVPERFGLTWAALVRAAERLAADGRPSGPLEALAAAERFSGWGERLVVDLLARALAREGLLAQALPEEPVLLAGDRQPVARPAEPSILATRSRMVPQVARLLLRGGVPVLPGYIARDAAGRGATLGRNGSDYSAAVIGAALGAQSVYIYSDVPGIYSADPRVVSEARLLPLLTYAEAAAIAALGARVLHPRTVAPLTEWAIPLYLRSSLAPQAPGTDIVPGRPPAVCAGWRWVVAAHAVQTSGTKSAAAGTAEITALLLGEETEQRRMLARAAAAFERARSAGDASPPLRLEPPYLRVAVAPESAQSAQRALHGALTAAAQPLAGASGPLARSRRPFERDAPADPAGAILGERPPTATSVGSTEPPAAALPSPALGGCAPARLRS